MQSPWPEVSCPATPTCGVNGKQKIDLHDLGQAEGNPPREAFLKGLGARSKRLSRRQRPGGTSDSKTISIQHPDMLERGQPLEECGARPSASADHSRRPDGCFIWHVAPSQRGAKHDWESRSELPYCVRAQCAPIAQRSRSFGRGQVGTLPAVQVPLEHMMPSLLSSLRTPGLPGRRAATQETP